MSTAWPRVTCASDGRAPIAALYTRYWDLAAGTEGIAQEALFEQPIALPGQSTIPPLPIICLRTPPGGPALWLLAGIHGEEPAGPLAVAESTTLFRELRQRGIPFVLFPLCNPKGYLLDWRYPDLQRQRGAEGHSVGDCEHLLADAQDGTRPRRREGPSCPEAGALTRQAIALLRDYPPLLAIDLHEDELADPNAPTAYVYAQGRLGAFDPVAAEALAILRRQGFAVPRAGATRFGEPIVDGIVPPTRDGSIDEWLACGAFIREGRRVRGPSARSVIVVETPTAGVPLAQRVTAHAAILRALPHLWSMAGG